MRKIDNIVITTNTLYKKENEADMIRFSLAKKTIHAAVSLGYKTIVVDSGSPDNYVDEFKQLGASVFRMNHTTMGEGRRECIKKAYETNKEVIVWTEPEKVDFIQYVNQISQTLFIASADIAIPRRKSLVSYPVIQQYSEQTLNIYLDKLLGLSRDWCFGPRIWKRELSEYFLSYTGEYGDTWDAIFIPLLKALSEGKQIGEIEIPYEHPVEQTRYEDSNLEFYKKRIQQLVNITSAVEAYCKTVPFFEERKN